MNATIRSTGRLALLLVAALTLPLLVPGTAHGQTYWFEEYARAVSLVDRQQMDEASEILVRLIQQHPVPLSGSRIYGDTYLDYFPYYQRARIDLYRGDLEGAAHNLDICEAFGAILQSQKHAKQLQLLRRQITEMEKNRTARVSPAAAKE